MATGTSRIQLSCPECHGPDLPEHLRHLGNVAWVRCRHCGWDWSPDGETRIKAHGAQTDEDGTYWRRWWLLTGPLNDEEALYLAGSPAAHYSGPGRSFSDGPNIRRQGHRVLVTQSGGLDI